MRIRSPQLTREALINWLAAFEYSTFVTLTFNPNQGTNHGTSNSLLSGGIRTATKALNEWDAALNRKAIGPKWLNTRSDRRLVGQAFLENITTNIHWHIVCTPPVPKDSYGNALYMSEDGNMPLEEFSKLVDDTWRKLCYNGTTKTIPIDVRRDLARYITKQCNDTRNYEAFVPLGPRLS